MSGDSPMSPSDHDVSQRFSELMLALRRYESSLRTYAAAAVMKREDANAQSCWPVIESVNRGIREIEASHKKLFGRRPVNMEADTTEPKILSTHKKGPRSTFSITLDGKEVEGHTAAVTFVRTIEAIGLARVAALGLTLSGIALVAKSNSADYQSHVFTRGYYVCTHASNRDKKKILGTIAHRLGLNLTVSTSGKP